MALITRGILSLSWLKVTIKTVIDFLDDLGLRILIRFWIENLDNPKILKILIRFWFDF
jgi:hypothetical protein